MNHKAAYLCNMAKIAKLESLRDKDISVLTNSHFPHIADGDSELFFTENGSLTNSLLDADLTHDQNSELFRSSDYYCLMSIDEWLIDENIERLKEENKAYIDKVMYGDEN